MNLQAGALECMINQKNEFKKNNQIQIGSFIVKDACTSTTGNLKTYS